MLTGIIQVGEYVAKNKDIRAGASDAYLQIVENPNENGNYVHVMKLAFKLENEIIFGVEYEEFSEDRIKDYVYKKGSPRGGDITPTSKYTDAQKTLNKILISLNNLLDSSNRNQNNMEEIELFEKIKCFFESNLNAIQRELENKINNMPINKKESFIITTTVYINGEEKYLGEFTIVQEHLNKMADERYFIKYGKVSKGEGTCFYCKGSKTVFGFVNTFNSYTVDKRGAVSNGFNQENAWKNYPVCSACAHKLEQGKKYIKENLSGSFSRYNYMIIPKSAFGEAGEEDFIESLSDYEKKQKKFSLSKTTKENLLGGEDNYLEIMQDSKNLLNYNILIYKEEQSGNVFRILAYIEDILPSRLKKLLRVKDEIDRLDVFHNLPGKDKKTYNLEYSFNKLVYFFLSEGNYDKSFLEVLNNIFSNKNISYQFLLHHIMNKISSQFANDEYFDNSVLQGLMNILYINKLNLFNDKEKGGLKVMGENVDKKSIYASFFEQEAYKEFFNTDYKIGVFLLGVLVKKLLNIQYKDYDNTPFYSRLNGLKLNKQLIIRIYTETINKLMEYNKNHFYLELEELISERIMAQAEKESISNDEIGFYFVLGMTLNKRFKQKEENENGEE